MYLDRRNGKGALLALGLGLAVTAQAQVQPGSIVVGAPTGGNKGAGSINAQSIYVNGASVGSGLPSVAANTVLANSAAIFSGTTSGNTLTVATTYQGALAIGQTIAAPGFTAATITAGSGTSWTFSGSPQTQATALTFTASATGVPTAQSHDLLPFAGYAVGRIYAASAPYNVSQNNADNGPGLNTAMADAASWNATLVLPCGQLAVTTPLVIAGWVSGGAAAAMGFEVGQTVTIDGCGAALGPWIPSSPYQYSGAGTWIYWNGSATSSPLLTVKSLGTLRISNVGFYGANNTQNTVYLTGQVNQQENPFQYYFDRVTFAGAANGGADLLVDNADSANNANLTCVSCTFQSGTNTWGYYQSGAPNAISQLFLNINCIAYGVTAGNTWNGCIYSSQGTIEVIGGSSDGSSVADFSLSAMSACDVRDLWSQNSYEFMVLGNFETGLWGCVVSNTNSSSYPTSFYQQGGTTTNPGTNPNAFISIQINSTAVRAVFENVTFTDPYNGSRGVITPLIAQTATSSNAFQPVTILGSQSWAGTNAKVTSGFYGVWPYLSSSFVPVQPLGATPVTSHQVPTTGFTIEPSSEVAVLELEPAGTLATGTIKLPPLPMPGQKLNISTTQTITALTYAVDTTYVSGTTIAGTAPTTMAANTSIQWTYDFSQNKWYVTGH